MPVAVVTKSIEFTVRTMLQMATTVTELMLSIRLCRRSRDIRHRDKL